MADKPMVAAHDQMMTLHISQHVEAHEPRESDPHYHLFDQAKRRLKAQGLWKCVIDDELCGGRPELHHSYVEFSEVGSTDPDKVAKHLGLHFNDDEDFQRWVEGPGNLEVLCSNHHRTRYGIHVLPEPLWQAVRYHKSGHEAPAHFVTAEEAEQRTTRRP
ncbi:hypothetical protein EDD90_2747 [Streptomyces sp. Ag109_O5-1]|uniref:hypothetical protein n=1 Tax=Streptomyces sp. Ag109_O5-1 TaxID=1938851 RepID=UPI000F4D86D1|nr:hypothetical protein [Streptomyces sp. Ag109_O5-1]RPE39730.1 hypothetical protein EDD90_2747 [Streptomyces sp. Ag109_O5-1]